MAAIPAGALGEGFVLLGQMKVRAGPCQGAGRGWAMVGGPPELALGVQGVLAQVQG